MCFHALSPHGRLGPRRQTWFRRGRLTTMSSSGCRVRYSWTYGQEGDDPQPTSAGVIEREADERGADALALVHRQHLGVDESDPPAGDLVFEDARELAIEVGLEALARGRVGDDRSGGRARESWPPC